MNRRGRRLRTTMLLIAAAAIAALTVAAQATDLLHRADLSTVNERFSVRGAQKPNPDVAIVAIDSNTFTVKDEHGNQLEWPFPRTYHAKVIDNLVKAGAKVIAYDVQFTEPSGDEAADNALIGSVRDAGPHRVVLATTEVGPHGRNDIFGGPEGLAYSRAEASFSAYPFDVDGRDRRMVFVKNGVPSFDMAAASLFVGHKIAPPPGRSAWIDFAGPPGSYRSLSFLDVYENRFPAAAVRGKVVVVGASASNLQDIHPTSTTGDVLMPGPEIHANGIATALAGFPLRDGPGWLDVLLVVALAVLAPLVALRTRIFLALGVGLLGIAALLVGAQLAFDGGRIVSVVYALIAGVLALLATGAIHAITVAFEREQARDAFARFVPEAVVDQVLKDAEGVRLGGVRSEATVMFSDLRGFTSFSESLEPERVIEALNRYLTAMSEAILDHGGTLVAYMGDGIMAVFGAPLRQEDHADRALAAAREMLARMSGFNAWLREEGLHETGFKMGIGLNSGPVMSGNVGSERRLEYTALGDTTNTAARLEGMTKGTPYQLYIADTTRARLVREVRDLVSVGEAEVRGRVAKVVLWSLADAPAPPGAAPSSEAATATGASGS